MHVTFQSPHFGFVYEHKLSKCHSSNQYFRGNFSPSTTACRKTTSRQLSSIEQRVCRPSADCPFSSIEADLGRGSRILMVSSKVRQFPFTTELQREAGQKAADG
jgi:hypothetical protein